jgi:hypothetical protein
MSFELSKTLSNPVQDMVLLIMKSFMPEVEILTFPQNKQTQPRICGGWVEVLPMISIGGQGQALPSAISCLAASISSLRQNAYSDCTVSLEKYGSAIRLLKREIEQPRKEILSRDEVAAAIMCLTLTEVGLNVPTFVDNRCLLMIFVSCRRYCQVQVPAGCATSMALGSG